MGSLSGEMGVFKKLDLVFHRVCKCQNTKKVNSTGYN